MTNLLDSPAFRLDPRARLGSPFLIGVHFGLVSSLVCPVQLAVGEHHHGHHRLAHGVAQPHVCAPHRPGQGGPDEVPAPSSM